MISHPSRSIARLTLLLGLIATLSAARPAGAVAVAGTNGDFDVTITGTKISIKYTPKASANCAKIVFVQSCLTKVDNVAVAPSAQNKKWKFQDDDTAADGKTCIDHVTCEADPYYNGDDAGKDGGKQGDSTTDPKKAAEMTDTPSPQLKNGATKVEYIYETCAYCATTGTFLDCISWSTTNDNGTTTTALITGANAAAASDAIKEAKTAFDTNHTKDGATFSQEATTATSGKKFDASVTTGAGLSSPPLPPGGYEAGTNLIELLLGTSPTQHTMQWRFEPVGSVSGVTIESGRRVLTVLAQDDEIFTGNPYGPPGQMQLACVDPVLLTRMPVISATVLQGNWSAAPGADVVSLSSPNMSPGGAIELKFDLGSAEAPASSATTLVLMTALLALAALVALRSRRLAVLLLVTFGAFGFASPAASQVSSFPSIVEGSPGAYASHLIKLTYMGDQKKSVASLGLHTASRAFTFVPFVPFYRPGHSYDNDGHAVRTTLVTTTNIAEFVGRMMMFPSLTSISDMPDPFLSVAITKPGLPDVVWEGLYTEAEATQVLGLLENRLRSNPTARAAVLSFKINCFGL